MARRPSDDHPLSDLEDDSREKSMKNRLSFVPKPVWWLGVIVVAVLLLAVPLHIHPIDTWIHELLHHEDMVAADGGESPQGQLWTCSMHPQVLEDHPGQCPICGMNLVPVKGSGAMPEGGSHAAHEDGGHAEQGELWTCSMHPQVLEDHPGQCPICGMNLVPVKGTDANGPAAAGEATSTGAEPSAGGERKILFYRNPMDPSITSPVPRKDDMGMDYVPVYADEAESVATSGAVVTIDPVVQQNMNVTTETVRRRTVERQIRTVGYLDYDQEKMVSVTTKYPGFVEKVSVNYLGQPVEKGEHLFDVYAPELVQTEQELLSAANYVEQMRDAPEDARRRAEALLEAAKTRLAYWDIGSDQIERLLASGTVFRTLAVTAPASGVVMKRMDGLEGMAIRPGMELMHIADLSSLWLTVEVFEDQLPWVRVGSPARVKLDYFPGESFTGRVRYIEPAVSEKTRSVRLTLEVPNPRDELRAGMYATVVFTPVAAHDAISVPSEAVLRTGERDVVILALGNGRFVPRDVVLGAGGDGWYEVRSGLEPGDVVVTSAQFLIDSESNLRAAIQQMIEARRRKATGGDDAR